MTERARLVAVMAAIAGLGAAAPPASETWRFDRIDRLGSHRTTILGHPRLIETPKGKAVEFNGKDDALFVDVHPLAGAEAFTMEIIFRPDPGGAPEQRFFHMQENDVATRLLLEIRVIGDRWCLDGYGHSGETGLTLIDREKLFPLGAWYQAALVYDGRELRTYVNGVLQASGAVRLAPQGAGRTSVGTRINRVDYFKGAVLMVRMSRKALAPAELLKVDSRLR